MTVFGVILAGGNGRRLGGVDKSALRIGSESLLNRLLKRLEHQADEIAISSGIAPLGTSAPSSLPVLVDDFDPQIGPLGGIDAGYRWASSVEGSNANDRLLIAPVDTPSFPEQFVEMAEACIDGYDIVVAKYQDQVYPTCSLWRLGAAENIAKSRAGAPNNSIRAYFDMMNVCHLDFADKCAQNPFKNVNKISDLIGFDARLY